MNTTAFLQAFLLSVACAVSIYEAMRQKKAAGQYDQSRIPESRVKEIKKEWGFLTD